MQRRDSIEHGFTGKNLVKEVLVIASLCVFMLAIMVPMNTSEADPEEIKVGDPGHGYNYDNIADAVAYASDGDIITIMNDLVINERIYIPNKHITIKGDNPGITITRGTPFAQSYGYAGNYVYYNPSMLEVAVSLGETSSVILRDIIFDDASNPGGFAAADLYDAILSAYAEGCTITLDSGAKLINSGARTSILLTNGAKGILQPGSEIIRGTGGTTGMMDIREIWAQQGSELTFAASKFSNSRTGLDTYLIFADHTSKVDFSGTVDGSASGSGGYPNILYAPMDSEITYSGDVKNLTASRFLNVGGTTKLTTTADSKITDSSISRIISVGNDNVVDLYGEISNNNITGGGHAIYAISNAAKVTLHDGGKINGNTGSVAGMIYIRGTAELHVYGEISGNITAADNGGAMYLYAAHAYLYDTGSITGNEVLGSSNGGSGGAAYLNAGATFTMEGGRIDGNYARGTYSSGISNSDHGGGGLTIVRNSVFTMNGGTITGNTATIGGGVFVAGKDDAGSSNVGPKFIFNGGTITGNTATAIGTADVYYGADIAVSAGNNFVSSADKNHTIQIGKDAVIGEGFIGISSPKGVSPYGSYGFDKAVYPADKENYDMYIGGILLAGQAGISGAVPSAYSGYVEHSGLYVRSDRTSGDIEFKVSYPSDIQTADINNYFYLVGYQPLDASGALTGTPEYFVPVRQADGLQISLPADAAYTSGYAVVILAEPKAIPLTLTLTHAGDGTFDVDGSPGIFTFTFGYDGTLSMPVPDIVALRVTADGGWMLTALDLTAADGYVTDKLSAVSGDLINVSYYELADGTNTIHAVFSQQYSVTYTGDVVDGSNDLTATNGTDYTGTLTMAAGYERPATITVSVDSATVTVGTEYTYDQTTGAITISGSYITGDIEINAIGIQTAVDSDGFTITATADPGSVIDPSGSVIVSQGRDETFTFSSKPGYVIVGVSVDGINYPNAIGSGFYTFSDVQSNHVITVTTEPDPSVLHIMVDIVGGEGTAVYHIGYSSTYVRLADDHIINRNSDVYVKIEVGKGYRFVNWTGEVDSTDIELHFPDVTHTIYLTAHLDGGGTGGNVGTGDGGEWSPLNLICAIVAFMAGVVALIGGRGRTKEGDGEHRSTIAFVLRVASIVVGIISLIVFFITEDWTQPVVPIDKWTLLMFILFLISAAIALVSYHFDKDEEEKEEEDRQETEQ